MAKKKFDIKKTAMKFVKVAIPVLVAGIASVYGNDPKFLAIAPFISSVANFVKHKYGIDLKLV